MSEQMYAEPVSPWALNASQLDRLRARVAEAETELESAEHQASPWPERTRREAEVEAMLRELERAEFEAKLEARRQAQHREPAPGVPAATNAVGQQFVEPVPYFEVEQPRGTAPAVANARAVEWPDSFADRWALLNAAMNELRRIGAAG